MSKHVGSYMDIDLFEEISRQDLRKSLGIKVCKGLSRGEIISEPDECEDKVYVIESGQVKLYQISEDGREQTLDILGPGAIFGDLSLDDSLESQCLFASSEKDDSCVFIIPKRDFYKVLTGKPELALRVISDLSARLSNAQGKIARLSLKDAKVRLLSELLNLGRSFGKEEGRKISLERRFTHEQLASLIGTTRETVTKTIKSINEDCEGCVVLSKDRRFVLDKDKVLEVINSL